MSDLSLAIQLLFVIDRIEPPWLIVEWASSGETTEIHQPLLPEEAQEGQHWSLRLEPTATCTKGSSLITHPLHTDEESIELPSTLHLTTKKLYCLQFEGPL
ncbi:MAG: hypothetical protein ACPGTU_06135 [Myxococcota bacterium]